jgi:hypothetical protein
MTHKRRKKIHVLKVGCSFLRAEGFCCSWCVLYGGLGITELQSDFLDIKF